MTLVIHSACGEPVGEAIIGLSDPRRLEIVNISVDPTERGQGSGDALMKGIIDEANQRGLRRITGTFDPEQGEEDIAKNYYQKWGFTVTERGICKKL